MGADTQLGQLSEVCDKQVQALAALLSDIESKHKRLQMQLGEAEEDTAHAEDRCVTVELEIGHLRAELDHIRELELLRRHEVCRLEALLEAERLQGSLTEHRLKHALAEEQLHGERLRLLRDDALAQSAAAASEILRAYRDLEDQQATLADSAVYIRYLRRRVLELEVEQSRDRARGHLQKTPSAQESGVFSLGSVRSAIVTAVEEACGCQEDERRRRLRQLQLRWHPDKNPVLSELATEVTKLINEALAKHEIS